MSLPSILPPESAFTTKEWEEQRRPEILALFERHVYGVTPREQADCAFIAGEEETLADGDVLATQVTATLARGGKSCSFRFQLYRPARAQGPVPCFIMLNPFSRNRQLLSPERIYAHMPYRLLAEQGFAGVLANVDECCPDDPDAFREGLLELFPRRGPDGWGAIGAWAYAGSRVVDYLLSRPEIDPRRIAVCGCSRGGKAALWCGAQDRRIALIVPQVSGCTGAAVTRGKKGEHIRDITSRFPHWACERYAGYAEDEEALPVDQHMLLALCAPRPLYVSSASEDDWADPRKEFESCVLAGAAYALYGQKGVEPAGFPPVNTPLLEGEIGYHLRAGAHGCELYDWEQYLRFAARRL